MRYTVRLYHHEEGYSVCVPPLPGCWSEGDTEEAALAGIRDAIQDYVAAVDERIDDAEVRELEVQV